MFDNMWAADTELRILNWMSYAMIVNGVAAGLALTFGIQAPYGRYTSTSWGPLINARLAWFSQEIPALTIPVVLWFFSGGELLPLTNKLLFSAYIAHYIHRSLIYPWLVKGGKPTPFSIALLAFVFCCYNGFLQGRSLLSYSEYPETWIRSPKFMAGMVIFVSGMAINIHSDHTLRTLRQPGETGYKIPIGGMFNYVSGANFFGEIVEWTGFAIACWSLPATAYAIFTFCNIGPRAIAHHRWYLSKFDNYPKNRKALIPFLL